MAPTAAPSERRIESLAPALLELVHRTYVDLHHREPVQPIVAKTSLDHDLEFDSLARVELILRIEQAFSVHMPDEVLETAETCADLIRLIGSARPARVPSLPPRETAAEGPVVAVPETAGTLIEVLEWHAQRHGDRLHLRHVEDPQEQGAGVPLHYAELRERAYRVAGGIQALGVDPGRSVALMLPTGLDYFIAYFGVLIAGCVPIPIYPPLRPSQIEEHVRRHAGILDNAEAVLLITVPQARAAAQMLSARLSQLRRVATVAELLAKKTVRVPVAIRPQDIAFIQYTSGSTGNPKGVVLTHANLLANIRAFTTAAGIGADAVLVSWLPLYHDMGLIGTWLGALYHGIPVVLMSPLAFLARPARWLTTLSRHRGTISAAPNFAFDLCVKRVTDDEMAGLDLSAWRLAINGSEAVSPDTLARFAQRFASYGLDPHALLPVYGLAECSVGLLLPPLGQGARFDRVARDAFEHRGRAEPAAAEDANPLRFACCGLPLPGHEVRIVNEQGELVGERVEGRLQLRGPSVTQGYHRNPELSRTLFRDGWLDSGDRAYVADGQYYVTGRVKDIIIRGGRNLYPDEIEEDASAVEGVRRGCVVAFGVSDPQTGTERLVVLAETRVAEARARERMRSAIVAAVSARLGEPPDEVVLVPPKTVLKTSSGKLRRSATRDRYRSHQLERTSATVGMQLLRLASGALLPWIKRAMHATAALAYATWVWLLFAVFAPIIWTGVALTRRPAQAWAVTRAGARLILKLTATPVSVTGLAHLPHTGAYVLVANHCSYLDGLMLVAALPRMHRFVAKRELLETSLTRVFLQRLGCTFVERFAIQKSVEDARRLAQDLRAADPLIMFPEGTFAAPAALLPFHLGAFVVAARSGVPVIPVTLRGTRAMLRAGSWRPRSGCVTVTVAEPLAASQGDDVFASAVDLRERARAAILAHSGDADGVGR